MSRNDSCPPLGFELQNIGFLRPKFGKFWDKPLVELPGACVCCIRVSSRLRLLTDDNLKLQGPQVGTARAYTSEEEEEGMSCSVWVPHQLSQLGEGEEASVQGRTKCRCGMSFKEDKEEGGTAQLRHTEAQGYGNSGKKVVAERHEAAGGGVLDQAAKIPETKVVEHKFSSAKLGG
ncbi:hypothetical protein B0H19DRAFT_1073554 [Mycena capillaripes]|nr:hypothetical protein B0H19DRAFT_1073554 [Mycena capillaripes]